MKKRIVMALTALAVSGAGSALAAATLDLAGQYKAVGVMADAVLGKDKDPDRLVDQRLRMRFGFTVNEYVKVVYFGEIDAQWGDASFGVGRNDGAALGGDHVNLETKNMYAEVKFPGTPLTATIGLQGTRDNYDLTTYFSDMAGLNINAKAGMFDANVSWFKWIEGNRADGDGVAGGNSAFGGADSEDDIDFYRGQVSVMPMKNLKVGVELDYFRNQGSSNLNIVEHNFGLLLPADTRLSVERTDLYTAGIYGNFKAGIVGLDGWFLYNWGTLKTNVWDMNGTPATTDDTKISNDDIDVRGHAAGLKATVAAGPVTAFVRGMYWSDAGDDDDKIKSVFNPIQYGPEVAPYLLDGMPSIMLADGNLVGSYGGYAGHAFLHAAYNGYGLVGAVVNARFVPPSLKNFYAQGQFGYFQALSGSTGFQGDHEGIKLGTELGAKVGYKFAGGAFDVSLNGCYAWLGNFYAGTVNRTTENAFLAPGAGSRYGDGVDPDNPYRLYIAANVPF